MKTERPEAVDESAISELTITPDGRLFAFGITGPVAELLRDLPTAEGRAARIIEDHRTLDAREDGR